VVRPGRRSALSPIVTLLLVPTLYAFVVLDQRWIRLGPVPSRTSEADSFDSPSSSDALTTISPENERLYS
jgi:hypothetical protein